MKQLWASDGEGRRAASGHEHVLPTGRMHLAVRLSSEPITLVEDGVRRAYGHAVVGGARSGFVVKDVSAASVAVGVELRPGAARFLFGAPADALAERHTCLEDVWGRDASSLRDRLGEMASLERRLDALEAFLSARLARVTALGHPIDRAIADAVGRAASTPIAELVERSGYSHRVFIERFRGAVGLTPKTFARVERFQRVAAHLARGAKTSIADAALGAGYADQAHLSREFMGFAGISPAAYRALALPEPNHVPLDFLPSRSSSYDRPRARDFTP